MRKLDGGVWEAVSAYAKEGQAYKYCVQGRSGRTVYKTDPYGNRCCALPGDLQHHRPAGRLLLA